MANTSDARQRQEVRVEEGLNGRLLGGFAHARREQDVINLRVGGGGRIQERQQAIEAASRQVGGLERGEVGAGSLDRESLVIETQGSITFTQNSHPQSLTPQSMGKV